MVGILTEKPSARDNFAKALGGKSGTYNGEQYVIVASHGHLFEFMQPEQQVSSALSAQYKDWDLKNLPWNESDFSWKKMKKPGADATLADIASKLGQCDEIVIATDVDPTGEGELLAWEILDALNLRPRKWSRMYFTDEAPKSLQNAFVQRKQLQSMLSDMDYVKADYRSKFDFLTMQFTRIATKSGDGKSVLRQGRLKSAMVLIVGNQLKALAEYKKIPFYQNRFKDENGVVYTNPEEPQFPDKAQVPQTYKTSGVTVDSKAMKATAPPKLLDLATLSARLSAKGFKAQTVLDVYQKMYEDQVVSYPRTEDKVITPEQFNELLPKINDIAAIVGVDPSLLTHRTPRSTHVKTGGAHGANRPGPHVPASAGELDKYDGGSGLAREIYFILARNYLATLAEDYEYEFQKGHVTDYPKFVGSTSVPKKQGWKAVFDADSDEDDDISAGLGSTAEPFIHEGFPPKPTAPTMRWLMQQLEKHDVGTGATRTSIYAEVTNEASKFPLLIDKKGKLSMARYGEMSYLLLPDTHIGDLKLTEQLQADMRDIAAGKANPDVCLHRVQQMVIDDIKTMAANGMKMREELAVSMQSASDYAEGTWQGKRVRFKKSYGGHVFTDAEVADLLAGKEIPVMGVQGKTGTYNVKGSLQIQTYEGHKYVGFKATGYLNDDGSSKEVKAVDSSEYCTGTWKKKQIRFKRSFSGHTFTDDECAQLLAGKEISFQATSASGKSYTATGKLAKQSFQGREFIGFKPDFGNKR